MASPPEAQSSHMHLPDQNDSSDHRVQQLHVPSAIPDYNLEHKIQYKLEQSEDGWQHDPVNPRNWPPTKKWTTTAILALYTFVTPLASSIMAPGLPDVARNFDITNPTITALTLSIFLMSFAMSPLFAAPLSDVYGRFKAGFVGSTPVACGGGVVSDLFSERDCASAMPLYFVGPLIGPVVGPVMGGFIAESVGIQNVFYVVAAICGVAAVLGILLMRESCAPVIRLRREKISPDLEKAATTHPAFTMNKSAYLWINLKQPVMIMTWSFICFILSLYVALMYDIYYLMFTTIPDLFSNVYHFSIGTGGLPYIGIGVGFLSATIFGARICDKIYLHLATENGGKGKPEMRAPALIFGSLFVPMGLL
ncbi:major facilitator superfamily domain-containing protein [Suillus placidus]|uniref:Major facilitator superfamily domain-containing protein n=1 Tax=Suillus placidus TaxID=48579 RepID=A0A9P7CYC7_9AGAM|nr:major facilitator superfamily domain-containing protein [Suillus placidus]